MPADDGDDAGHDAGLAMMEGDDGDDPFHDAGLAMMEGAIALLGWGWP